MRGPSALSAAIAFAMLALGLATAPPARAQPVPLAVAGDPAPERAAPASMVAPEIESHGARMNAVFYLASGAAPHPTVLLLHGFPGFEQNLDLAQAIRRAGWNVLLPRYRGAWGSQGAFSFGHALEDAAAALAFLRDPQSARRYRIDPRRIVAVGHSMGGFVAAYLGAHQPGLAGLVMISSWNLGGEVSRLRPGDDASYLAGLRDGMDVSLAGCTAEGLLAEAKTHARDWDFTRYAEGIKQLPVLLVDSDDGNAPESEALAAALQRAGDGHVNEVHLHTDHAYSDHRVALASVVVQWLQRSRP